MDKRDEGVSADELFSDYDRPAASTDPICFLPVFMGSKGEGKSEGRRGQSGYTCDKIIKSLIVVLNGNTKEN